MVPTLLIGGGEGGDGEEGGGGGAATMASRPSRASRVSNTGGSRRESSKRRTDGTGLYEPPSYQDQARKRMIVEKVTKIVSGIDMMPRIFKGSGEVEPKLWQEAATSLQSPLMNKIKRNLRERKQKMKTFTANPKFEDYFNGPKGPEYRPMPSLVESTMGSKEEVVSREVIHKTAMAQLRKLQGVWAELGKPYVSLGVPNVNVSHDPPMPEKPYGVDGVDKLAHFDYFPVPPITAVQRQEMHAAAEEASMPPSKKKRELQLKYSRAASEMDRMLQKMGLMFFHDCSIELEFRVRRLGAHVFYVVTPTCTPDSDHVKFPKAPLIAAAKVTNLIKQGGNFIEEIQTGMLVSLPRRMSMQPLEGEQYILGAGGKAIPIYTDGPPSSAAKSATEGTSRPTTSKQDYEAGTPSGSPKSKSHKEIKTYPPRDDSLVFGWKKKILELRLQLERELENQIADRADRRERWRSSSLFSSEVSKKVYKLLDKSHGRIIPNTTAVWKEAEYNFNATQVRHTSAWEFKVFSINRFYDRICSFTVHQPMADPLLDVLIFFLKEWLENGGRMKRSLLEHLCASLARLPEDIMVLGRMACVMPVLQFICKELHVTSTQFKNILRDTRLDRCHLG